MTNGKKLFLAAIILIIIGIVMSVMGLLPPAELKDGADADLGNLDPSYAYYLEDMELFDEYATSRGGEGDNGSFYIGLIEASLDEYYLFSVYVDNDTEWKNEARDHNFTNINLSVPACYRLKKVSSIDEDLERYYSDYTEELIANSAGATVVDTGLHLRFVCNEMSEYEDAASNIEMTYIGAALAVLGIILIFVANKVKAKEAEAAARAAAAAAAAAAYYNPQPAEPQYYDPNRDSTTASNNAPQGPEF